MIVGAGVGGCAYSLTSVPQIPATSIFIKAASSGISGMGNSRISVLLGPVLTAACTFSTGYLQSMNVACIFPRIARVLQSGYHRRRVGEISKENPCQTNPAVRSQ